MKLGILDLLQPPFAFGLFVDNIPGQVLSELPDRRLPLSTRLPEDIHNLVNFMHVEGLHTASDETGVVYSGKAIIIPSDDDTGELRDIPKIRRPSGAVIEPGGLSLQFRLTYPRRGSASIHNAIQNRIGALSGDEFADLTDLGTTLDLFGDVGQDAQSSDFPTKDFRLELMLNSILLYLPKDKYLPAKLDPETGWLIKDDDFQQVTLSLPKIAIVIEQGTDSFDDIEVRFEGWGVNSLDDPNDNGAGEAIRMTPSLALNSKKTFGFGFEKIVLDLSREYTPVEILEQNFGTGDDFRGLWVPEARLFFAQARLKGMAVDTWVEDLLYDFDQGLSGEFGVALINGKDNQQKLEVLPVFHHNVKGQDKKVKTVKAELKRKGKIKREPPLSTASSEVTVSANATMQINVRGGDPPYHIEVKINHVLVEATSFVDAKKVAHPNRKIWKLPAGLTPGQDVKIEISVNDRDDQAADDQALWKETITAHLTKPVSAGESTFTSQPVVIENEALPSNRTVRLADNQPEPGFVWLEITPQKAILSTGGTFVPASAEGRYRVTAPAQNESITFSVIWENEHRWKNSFDPGSIDDLKDAQENPAYENIFVHTTPYDEPDSEGAVRDMLAGKVVEQSNLKGFMTFIGSAPGQEVHVYGYASYEVGRPERTIEHNRKLSLRRAKLLAKTLKKAGINVIHTEGLGASLAQADNASPDKDPTYHVAIAFFTPPPAADLDGAFTLRRPADAEQAPEPADVNAPRPDEPKRPPIFRRAHLKVRLQRNDLVYGELFGEFDVARQVDESAQIVTDADGRNAEGAGEEKLSDGIETSEGASESNDRGIIDFTFSNSYDPATSRLRQVLDMGFDRDLSRNGLLTLRKPAKLKALYNTATSILLFAPLLGEGVEGITSAEGDSERVKNITIAAAELAIATGLGLTVIDGQAITLFGGALSVEELSTGFGPWDAQSLEEVGLLFDYGVEFKIDLNLFDFIIIRTRDESEADEEGNTRPLAPPSARYRAIGLRMNFQNGARYIPVFDTSKGYELSLGDPGALEIRIAGQYIGNLLRVQTVRVARQNPLRIELDLALNVNLGIITVETLRVVGIVRNETGDTPSVDFSVYPTAVAVDIPGALTGRGYLNLGRPEDINPLSGGTPGFGGFIDLTIVPIKLRVAAGVGVATAQKDGRSATAVFIAMEAEFPSAVPLGGSGLGIYGFLGLFAMHYRRMELPESDSNPVPALQWFDQKVHGNVLDIQGWTPDLDRWSFGLGIILGTMEGGFTLNLKGMFMLEIPGPRVLIFVKAQLLEVLPEKVENDEGQTTAGILAVIDLDFRIGRLTIGLTFSYEVKEILTLQVPIESKFTFQNPAGWYLNIGSQRRPATAEIFGRAEGYAFIMISGNGLELTKKTGGVLQLQGFSVGVGFGASLVLGDRDSGLYLEVGGDLLAAIGFAPLHVYGYLELRGQLHLWIVSISARASLEVEAIEAPDGSGLQTRVHGSVCGKVSFFFFDIEGCVEITIGNELPPPSPPALVTGLTLVSRSSVLTQNQATDRPVDGAYGRAAEVAGNGSVTGEILSVPIDSILALNLFGPPLLAGCDSFATLPSAFPNQGPGGWISLGGDFEVQYRLTSISLSQPLYDSHLAKPATWWPRITDNSSQISATDLALLSWVPDPIPHAIQRSIELTEKIKNTWSRTCARVAPATSVLWTFIGQPVGYSAEGWHLTGAPWPDPPDAFRSTSPDLHLFVRQSGAFSPDPMLNIYRKLLKKTWLENAKVIGEEIFTGIQSSPGLTLQFPHEHYDVNFVLGDDDPVVPDEIKALLQIETPESILLETGRISGANLWVAIGGRRGLKILFIRSYDAEGVLLAQKEAWAYPHTQINEISDFPDTWEDPNGPWLAKIWTIFQFIDPDFKTKRRTSLQQYVIAYQPESEQVRRIELVVIDKEEHQPVTPPAILLCGVEMIRLEEVERVAHDGTIKTAMQEAVDTALGGDKLRALLQPATVYDLTVEYEYQQRKSGQITGGIEATSQRFRFQTDAVAPARLDPWVLATTPEADCPLHFVDDPVQLFFNHASVIQLFGAYGVEMRAYVLKANGKHPEQDNDNLNLAPANLQPVQASILSPFGHTIREVAADLFPCIDTTGQSESHQVQAIPVPLQRSTSYVVEVTPKTSPSAPPGTQQAPLFRFAFTTSRYRGPDELAGIVLGSPIQTRLLRQPLVLLPTEITDNMLQQALQDSGMSTFPPAGDPTCTLLWAPDGDAFVLNAMLIDSPEPLWRRRPLLVEESIDSENGPMTHWVLRPGLYLEVGESADTAAVQQITRTESGARALIYLKGADRTPRIKLELCRRNFAVSPTAFAAPENLEKFTLLDFELPVRAPWVEE